MPLTPEQLAALDALVAGEDAPLKGATPQDIADGLKQKFTPATTLIFNEGSLKSSGQDDKTVKRLRKDLERAETERDTLKQQIASGAPPEVKKQLDDQTAEIARLRGEIKTKDEEHERERREAAEAEVFGLFGSLLEDPAAGNLRKPWARVLAADPEVRKRVEVKIEDGKRRVTVYQQGKAIPMPADDDTPEAMLKALAVEQRERLKKDEPEAIKAEVEAGGGVVNGEVSGEAGGYDPVKAGKEMAEKQKNAGERNKNLAYT
jgi:hypothetical protein